MDIKKLYEATNNGLDIIKWIYPDFNDKSKLDKRTTEKYGDVWYTCGDNGKWYSPIDVYIFAHQMEKTQFKEALHEIAKNFGFEKKGGGKGKKESLVDDDEVARIASKLIRIGSKWYQKTKDPLTQQQVLYPISSSVIFVDYGKEIGNLVQKLAQKYLGKTNIPSHIDYQECIDNGDGSFFYNIYRPINYKPGNPGNFRHIDMLIDHVFGEQYEKGMDYVQLMYLHPMRRLPVLVLVSRENCTGKSTFCNFLRELFGENCQQIDNDTLRSNFNSTWITKLVVYCEETLLNRREDSEKIKNLVTAKEVPSEAKGKDRTNVQIYLKFILCSNDEDHPIFLNAEDTRHWVRRVPPIENKNPNEDFLEECKKEIPAFLRFLTERELSTKGTDRLWFSPEETRTDAWRRIVAGGMSKLEREIIDLILSIMVTESLDEIKYDAEGLYQVVKGAAVPYDLKVPFSRAIVRDMLRSWGFRASQTAVRYKLYVKDIDGSVTLAGDRVGRAYTIDRKTLESLTN